MGREPRGRKFFAICLRDPAPYRELLLVPARIYTFSQSAAGRRYNTIPGPFFQVSTITNRIKTRFIPRLKYNDPPGSPPYENPFSRKQRKLRTVQLTWLRRSYVKYDAPPTDNRFHVDGLIAEIRRTFVSDPNESEGRAKLDGNTFP